MNEKILDRINSPTDLKSLPIGQLEKLAEEIRDLIIDVVSENGGHLAPNLGSVEMTIAIHRVFDSPSDKIVWDVGHQTYAHKIISGRREFFKTLRQYGGCSGFPSDSESEHDCFISGHAGTAISAALGFAAARDMKKGSEKIIALIGDGSLTCGSSLEALNSVASTTNNLIIVLNDNKMSISSNVGAISKSLNRLISTQGYNRLKALARNAVMKIPGLGRGIVKGIGRLEEAIKSVIVPGVFFEELGIRYIGPIDGHDIEEMIRTFNAVKNFETPVIVHLISEKGRGYSHAEKKPEKFHGLSPFNPDTGEKIKGGTENTFSSAFGDQLSKMASKNDDIVAITAAMKSGTGLENFAKDFPSRFFDVGIAEEHATIFAAGMAKSGLVPFLALYATFLQRSLDYVYHDICLQNLPVIICADRAGIVEDGPTHHGIYDLSFLRTVPGLSILCPKDSCELRMMMCAAYEKRTPCVIRYPRGDAGDFETSDQIVWGKAQFLREGKDLSIWASGRESLTAMKVAELLEKKGIKSSVINTRFIKPFDNVLLASEGNKKMMASIEDNSITGGLASAIREALPENSNARFIPFGWEDAVIEHGNPSKIRSAHDMTPEKIAKKIEEVSQA
ncbi:MAG TPA: 1-deoxy-D-xylulose-5-phosphate synthase [Victivallales bacterium]|nr:1-deoxy-D-xylulose-5-phosphate synthase [Victivallales bacterium]